MSLNYLCVHTDLSGLLYLDRSDVMHRIEHLHHVQSGRLSHYDTGDGLSVFTRSTGCPKKVTFRMLLEPRCTRSITSCPHTSLRRACVRKLSFWSFLTKTKHDQGLPSKEDGKFGPAFWKSLFSGHSVFSSFYLSGSWRGHLNLFYLGKECTGRGKAKF